jgi:DNA-binding transcriptional LysR family regulator
MEMRHVRVFLTLADELHFGRTAARLHVAQSAVSQTIKALEEDVGAALFQRTKRRVALTDAGRAFALHAQMAAHELERGSVAARRIGSGEAGRLTLRFTTMCALTMVPRAVARFRVTYPGIEIRIRPGGSGEQLEALASKATDLAFVSRATEVTPFASEPIETSPLVAFLPTRHPLAKKRSITLASLAKERWMFLTEKNEPGIRRALQRRLEAFGAVPDVVLEVDQLESILAFVAAGYGISLGPAFVSRLRLPGIAYVPLRPRVDAGIRVVWDPTTLSVAASRFLTIVREERRPERGTGSLLERGAR